MYPASAGNQLDLNHLWQQVQELSAILASNRESATDLARRANQIRGRVDTIASSQPDGLVNGETNGSSHELQLSEENQKLRNVVSELRAENEDLSSLVQDYETVLEKVLDGLRIYAHEHSVATINIHSSYTNQLANERQLNATLRQKEVDNEARLSNISQLLREAYQQQTMLGPDIVIAKLQSENRALREALGLTAD